MLCVAMVRFGPEDKTMQPTVPNTMPDLAINAVQNEVGRVSKRAEIIHLSLSDQSNLAQALLLPPKPVSALQRAFARRQKLLQIK
jgi:uncharacterized protein (DUF1778 family)